MASRFRKRTLLKLLVATLVLLALMSLANEISFVLRESSRDNPQRQRHMMAAIHQMATGTRQTQNKTNTVKETMTLLGLDVGAESKHTLTKLAGGQDVTENYNLDLMNIGNSPKGWSETNRNDPASSKNRLPPCPAHPPNLLGFKMLRDIERPMADLEAEFRQYLGPGGNYTPPECLPKERTAIIIPCRNRWQHLRILLNALIPIVMRQQLAFAIYVIESDQAGRFNKGVLLNIGVLESLKRDNYTCFVFQDVDLLPLDDRNLYRCGENPRHLAAAMDKFNFKLPNDIFFGGVLALSLEQVKKVNGHSNLYFGWGGEDDDIHHRVRAMGYKVVRYPLEIAKYHMIKHELDKGNEEIKQKSTLVTQKWATIRMFMDGLNNTRFDLDNVEVTPLFTWIQVTINQTEILQDVPYYLRPLFKHGLESFKQKKMNIKAKRFTKKKVRH